MTRLICIGDCHFGPQGGRNDDRYRALDQIIAHGEQLEDLGAWLLAGDLNHAKMTIEDRNQIAPRLQAMARLAPVVGVRGNHDVDGDLAIFERLDTIHPITFETQPIIRRIELANGGGEAAIFCLPYIFKAGLVTAGVEHGDLGQQARAALEPVFMTMGGDLARDAAAGALPILLAHMNIGGAISSIGQPQIGQDIELDPGLLGRLGNVPKIFGHIHKHQRVAGAWFLGSIARMDFGEREDKVFGVLEYATPAAWDLEFVPLDVPRQLHVDGRLGREGFQIQAVDGETTDDIVEDVIRGADVRVRYRFNKAEVGALDVAHIHATFAGCRSLKLDPIAEVEHTVRAPEIAAAATLDEKVLRYAERQQIPVTAGLRTKLTALQALEAEQVLSQVATQCTDAGAAPAVAAEAGAF